VVIIVLRDAIDCFGRSIQPSEGFLPTAMLMSADQKYVIFILGLTRDNVMLTREDNDCRMTCESY
jgi:hypothetical protein